MNESFVSLFAGIEGTGLGLERAGWKCVAQVENNAFCNKVRSSHYPSVAQFGDIRGFGVDALTSAIGERDARSVELVCGGFPCQDLSVAGKRAGLTGSRSGLFWEFVRVARELRPTWILVENVPGLRSSSKGRDFGTLLHALDELGYFVEGATLDSRYFGVPQRRRRMFFVGHLGGPPARPVLFEPEGSYRNPAALRATAEDIAGSLGAGAPGARGYRNDLDSNGAFVVSRALTGTMGKRHDPDTDTLVGTLGGGDYGAGRHPSNLYPNLVHALTSGGADASEDGTGRGTPIIAAPLTNGANGNAGRRREDDENLVAWTASEMSNSFAWEKPYAPTLDSHPMSDTSNRQKGIRDGSLVRRLTPTECERLQGFPDGWTCLETVGTAWPLIRSEDGRSFHRMMFKTGRPYATELCKCADGPRYAALGNAVTVPVAEWVGWQMRLAA